MILTLRWHAREKNLSLPSKLIYLMPFSLFPHKGEPGRTSADSETKNIIDVIRDKRLRVLIVDDNADFRKSMAFMLRRKYAADVEVVESGLAAIERLKARNLYDLILLDLMMPKMSGVETYHELKTVDDKSRIVLMSAYSDSEEWGKAKDLEAMLLHKPISEEKMMEILSHCEGASLE